MNGRRARIGVVGAGPKALFALQELHARLPDGARVAVDVFDPAAPGGGAVWDPELPAALRLNAPAAMVDARGAGWTETLADWIERVHPGHAGEPYPPRRLVGEYLRLAFEALAAGGRLELRHHRVRIGGLGDGSGLIDPSAYDEVLLATGHAGAPPRPAEAAAGIPAGAEATVRGAALTGLDAVLLLTEARGGRWRALPADPLGLLAYEPSGAEPSLIRLASRTGVLMAPKPEHPHPGLRPIVEAAAASVRDWGRRVRTTAAAPDPAFPHTLAAAEAVPLDPLWRVLISAGREAADAYGVQTSGLRLWRALLTGCAGAEPEERAGRRPAEFLRSRLAIDAGLARPDEPWILGRLWQGVYRDMVGALDRLPRSARDQRRFRAIAAQQERSAFGPPAETVRKLLALLDAGLVEISVGVPAGGAIVDAVTTGPGILAAPAAPASAAEFHDPLYADLDRRALTTVRPGERGILTDADAACVGPAGHRTGWLSALGRPTEDPVLGHDTLDRTLHDDGRRWAAAVVDRLARRQEDHGPRKEHASA
ncbi:FAD/NAD(P)-binding protein [Zhihengliuella salsuginis]|uniref:FAD-dependent urate hydroxylase HpyO/Asp monooxygenase CreE-like FAD/NAD(P)-binding domain-containing protein n=1 Tax=Zhihengliuella salsuginis TaxID=578222 RepID=A0ABQ3GAG8_9MICC|nr:FAD/NAD(P)-binding protein [Zhihengliuella salsuginis]GHC99704.1 hypothetical protein GCM10008096_02140 [Zhihengliuella salsuginis]